jgi:protein-S-isoprenylcysteine O-methyltransferase Ste14
VIEPLAVTLFPVVFLIILFGGGALMHRRHVDTDGDPPIDRRFFYASKYSIVAVWAVMVAQAWGLGLPLAARPDWVRWASTGFWVCGFVLLLAGRLTMGEWFRMGSPQERTGLRVDGLFKVSRNPMYLGVFTTLLAATLYTLNPLVPLLAIFIVAVHHRIVLAEEAYLQGVFGGEYIEYCRRVGRYF